MPTRVSFPIGKQNAIQQRLCSLGVALFNGRHVLQSRLRESQTLWQILLVRRAHDPEERDDAPVEVLIDFGQILPLVWLISDKLGFQFFVMNHLAKRLGFRARHIPPVLQQAPPCRIISIHPRPFKRVNA